MHPETLQVLPGRLESASVLASYQRCSLRRRVLCCPLRLEVWCLRVSASTAASRGSGTISVHFPTLSSPRVTFPEGSPPTWEKLFHCQDLSPVHLHFHLSSAVCRPRFYIFFFISASRPCRLFYVWMCLSFCRRRGSAQSRPASRLSAV